MVTVKNDAHRKQTAAKNHGVFVVENRVAFRADFRSNREALFEEEVDIIFSHPFTFGDFCDVQTATRMFVCFCGSCKEKKKKSFCFCKFCCFLHKKINNNNNMLKRRRGQNASITPAFEHIEVDADILRASLTCEVCKNILREANTVVCFLY